MRTSKGPSIPGQVENAAFNPKGKTQGREPLIVFFYNQNTSRKGIQFTWADLKTLGPPKQPVISGKQFCEVWVVGSGKKLCPEEMRRNLHCTFDADSTTREEGTE